MQMSIEVRLESLRKGPQSVDEALERDTLEDRLTDAYRLKETPFRLKANATLYTNVVEIRGTIEGALSFDCSMCGETLEMNVNTPFHHSFVPLGELDISDADDVENSLDDNIDVSEHDGHAVQIDSIALEHFLVELPFAPSCESSDEITCVGEKVELEEFNETQGEMPDHPFHAALKKLKLSDKEEKN